MWANHSTGQDCTCQEWVYLSCVGKDSIWHRHIELIVEFHALSPLVRHTKHPCIRLHHESHFLIAWEKTVPGMKKINIYKILHHKSHFLSYSENIESEDRIQYLWHNVAQRMLCTSSCFPWGMGSKICQTQRQIKIWITNTVNFRTSLVKMMLFWQRVVNCEKIMTIFSG